MAFSPAEKFDRAALKAVRHIVVKIGSAVLAPDGALDHSILAHLASQMAALRENRTRVTLVTSGAVASGYRLLGFAKPPTGIVHKQCAAAIGQPRIMAAWEAAFAPHGITVAQTLYTSDDLATRVRYQNTRRTLGELLARNILPIVNENDTTSYDEIKLGDNDRLSALTADLVGAELLLILSTAHGLYEGGDARRVISEVEAADGSAARHVTAEKTLTGTGGMATKLIAAATAAKWGIATVVAGGRLPDVIGRVIAGENIGTLFRPNPRGAKARKRWLGSAARCSGAILIDAGAAKAMTTKGASLLPSGVVGVRGEFGRDEVVEIIGPTGSSIARGISAYAGDEVAKLAGKKTSQIIGVLGYCLRDEIVHRSDLVLADGGMAK